MRILDYADLGILPLQHHEDGVLTGRRYQAAAVRISKGPAIAGGGNSDDGLIRIARVEGKGTIGDVHPVGYWQTKARDERATGSWSPVFPALVSDVGPAAGQTTAGPSGPTMRPVEGGWVQDVRYSPKQGAWPPSIQRMPKNTMSLALFGTDETEQRDIMATVDPRLFCPTTEGPADCGTLVVDLQGPGEPCMDDSNEPGVGGRAARIQSMMRVIPLNQASANPIGVGPGNAIAWNLSSSRRDNLAGYGLVWGKADSAAILGQPTTGGGGPTTGGGTTYLPPPGFGQPGGGLTQPTTPGGSQPLLAAGLAGTGYGGPADTVGGGAVSVFSSGHFQPKPQAAHASALMAAVGGFGPLHVGNVNDKHRISVDRDGNPINAGHISTRAYYYADQQRDAPLEFSGFYPKPKQLPHQSRVFLTYDREARHVFRGQAKEGMWRWYAETHVIVPSPPEDDDEDIPQYGLPIPPLGKPTTGGGGGPGGPGSGGPGGPGGGGTPTTGGPGTPGGGPGGPTTGGGGIDPGGQGDPGGEGFPEPGQGGEGGAGSAPTGPTTGPHGGLPLGGEGDEAPSDSSPGGGDAADPSGPDEPDKPNPYGEESQLQDGDEPVGENDNPITDPTPIPKKEDGSIDHSKLKDWYPRHRRRVREWLRQSWNKHQRGWPWPDEEEERRPDTTAIVGEMSPGLASLFSIFHPMNEGFAALNFRPQLLVPGAPMFEHNPNLGDLAEVDETQRPQVLACRAWGAITEDGDWDYQRRPEASRARGGVANGGILFSPPCMELEDYAGMAGESMDTDAPLTTGYVAFARGTCLGFGTPNFQTGGMGTYAATIGASSTNYLTNPLVVSHSGSTGVPQEVASFGVTSSDRPEFIVLGTYSIQIPRGTTAERPTKEGPHVRINSSGANDFVEFYDQQLPGWTTLESGGGGGTWGSITGTLSSQTDLQTALDDKADDGDVTASGLTMATARMLGRTTASTGAIEEITVGTGLTLASGTLTADAPAWGDITGTLSSQTDLQTELDGKADDGDITLSGLTVADPGTILGREGTGGGAVEMIRIGSGLTLSSLILSADPPAWGDITGTLSSQTDLQTALDGKADDGDVTASGLTMATDRLLGRDTASTGAVEEIEIGTGLSLSSGVLSATGGSGGVIDAVAGNPATSVSETSNTSAANFYSYTIPASTLASGKVVRVTILGTFIQNSGADQNVTLRLRLGGTEYLQSTNSFPNDTDPIGLKLVIDIAWTASSVQYIRMDIERAGAFSSASGYGHFSSSGDGVLWAFGAEDSTTDLLLEVRGTFGTSTTSSLFATYSAQAELIG